jgi:hypothetical protein
MSFREILVANVVWLIILVGLPGFVALASLLLRASRFVSRQMIHPDLAISPFANTTRTDRLGEMMVKLAYSGSVSLVVSEMRLRSHLDFPNNRYRIVSWFQLLRGYLTNDIEGLQAMLGPRLVLAKSPFARIGNIIIGILWLVLLLSWLYSPIGWLAILLAAPNVPVELSASDDQIQLVDMVTKNKKNRPLLVKPGQEAEYMLSYRFSVNGIGFQRNYQADYVNANEIPQKPVCKLPRPREFVRRTEEKLLLKAGNRWVTYSVTLGERFVRLSPPTSC